jgi:hypothetical protein
MPGQTLARNDSLRVAFSFFEAFQHGEDSMPYSSSFDFLRVKRILVKGTPCQSKEYQDF